MAFLTLAVLLLAISGLSSGVSGGTWCVCKEGNDAALQKALDYACGAGADCTPLRQGGACYQPNTLRAHCSYAVNSYYLKNHASGATCEFSGAATLSSTDPSASGCSYPASSGSGTSTTTPTPVTTPTTGTTPATSTTPTTTVTPTTGTTPTTTTATPYSSSSTPAGGFSTGLAPTSTNTDYSHGGLQLRATFSFLSLISVLPLLLLLN